MAAFDPTSNIPPGIARPAMPPGAPGVTPPGAGGGMQLSPPLDPNAMAQLGAQSAAGMPDLFQRVAMLMIQDPQWVYIMAGLGLGQALEKSGKYESKPHRSNEELAAGGMNVGNQGQAGFTSPEQMVRQLPPPMPPSPQ